MYLWGYMYPRLGTYDLKFMITSLKHHLLIGMLELIQVAL